MSTTAEKIAEYERRIKVMQAFERGEVIENKPISGGGWEPNPNPAWGWHYWDHRIKPKPREWWDLVSVSCGVLGRYSTKERALDSIKDCEGLSIVHVIEVIEP